jgi:hypothetical protein
MTIKKDLLAISKDLKRISQKTDRLILDIGKIEKQKVKPTKARATKKVLAKKKAAKSTATDQVLRIIMRRKRGIDTPTLMHKTGFDERKVRNIVFKASKEGKIQRVGRGLYAGVK